MYLLRFLGAVGLFGTESFDRSHRTFDMAIIGKQNLTPPSFARETGQMDD
jgi:hypothetical protein